MAAITTSGGGRSWQRIVDPPTGYIATKTSGWTADSFSGGLTVDFSSAVPAGTVAVLCFCQFYDHSNAAVYFYYRPYGDTNIANSPYASLELSHCVFFTHVSFTRFASAPVIFYLSQDYRIQIASRYTTSVTNVAYPSAVLL